MADARLCGHADGRPFPRLRTKIRCTGCAGTDSAPPSTIGQTATPITEEEARSFAAKFIDAVSRNDMAAVSAVFDWDTLADRALDGVPLTETKKQEAKTGMMRSLTQNNTLIPQIHQQMQQGDDAYQLLRVHEVDGRRRALLRLLPPDGGVNYHDMVLSKSADGQCRAIDIHIFTTGELLSATVKRGMLQLAATQNRSLIDRLTGRDKLMVKPKTRSWP